MGSDAIHYTSPGTPISYWPHGAVAQMTLNNGLLLEQSCYNNRLQATVLRQRTGTFTDCATHPGADASDLLHLGYDYGSSGANNGNVLVQTETVWPLVFQQSNQYDRLNRLSSASETGPGTGWSQTYGHDPWGNHWVSASPGVPQDPFTPIAGSVYDGSNHMNGSGAQYDSAGNQKQIGGFQFQYDAENRLTSSTINSTTAVYSYDGDGRRVLKQSGGVTTVYVYDAQGQLAAEYTVSGPAPASPCQTCYLMADHLGSTRMMRDAGGGTPELHDYLPFGEEIPAGVDGRDTRWGGADPKQKFTGKERDAETGLDYFGARYFSAAMGRWTSPDLINLTWDRLGNPSNTLNKYVYAANNPLKFTDPDGQDVTLFYRPSTGGSTDFGDYGHVFLAAYDQSTKQVEFLDYYPAGGLQRQGLEMVGPGAVNAGTFEERRSGYASLTVQTTPEITQKVMQFMREFKANPSAYRFPTNTCVTACRAALEIAGIRVSAYSPAGLWSALFRRYSPLYQPLGPGRYGEPGMPPISSTPGMDSGSPRADPMAWQRFLFNIWLEQIRRQRDEEERKKREREYEPPGYGR